MNAGGAWEEGVRARRGRNYPRPRWPPTASLRSCTTRWRGWWWPTGRPSPDPPSRTAHDPALRRHSPDDSCRRSRWQPNRPGCENLNRFPDRMDGLTASDGSIGADFFSSGQTSPSAPSDDGHEHGRSDARKDRQGRRGSHQSPGTPSRSSCNRSLPSDRACPSIAQRSTTFQNMQ